MAAREKSSFILVLHGNIETAQFPENECIWMRYTFVSGADWVPISGMNEGISAVCYSDHDRKIVLDTPLEITFRSTNPFRWPQLVTVCYGKDLFGNEVIRGYGSVAIPTIPGRHHLQIACSVPEPSSIFQKIIGLLWGRRAELVDANCMAQQDGRNSLRMSTQGIVRVTLNLLHKDMKKNGFDCALNTLAQPSSVTLPNIDSKPRELPALAVPQSRYMNTGILLDKDEVSGNSDENDGSWRPPITNNQPRPLPDLTSDNELLNNAQ